MLLVVLRVFSEALVAFMGNACEMCTHTISLEDIEDISKGLPPAFAAAHLAHRTPLKLRNIRIGRITRYQCVDSRFHPPNSSNDSQCVQTTRCSFLPQSENAHPKNETRRHPTQRNLPAPTSNLKGGLYHPRVKLRTTKTHHAPCPRLTPTLRRVASPDRNRAGLLGRCAYMYIRVLRRNRHRYRRTSARRRLGLGARFSSLLFVCCCGW